MRETLGGCADENTHPGNDRKKIRVIRIVRLGRSRPTYAVVACSRIHLDTLRLPATGCGREPGLQAARLGALALHQRSPTERRRVIDPDMRGWSCLAACHGHTWQVARRHLSRGL